MHINCLNHLEDYTRCQSSTLLQEQRTWWGFRGNSDAYMSSYVGGLHQVRTKRSTMMFSTHRRVTPMYHLGPRLMGSMDNANTTSKEVRTVTELVISRKNEIQVHNHTGRPVGNGAARWCGAWN